MKRLKWPVVLSIFLLLGVSGCSVRPKDGTVVLQSDPAQTEAKGTYELKSALIRKSLKTTLLGWQGNDLMVYDGRGIYLYNYRTPALTPLLSYAYGEDGGVLAAALSNNGKKLFYSVYSEDGTPAQYVSNSDCMTGRVTLSKKTGYLAYAKEVAWSDSGKYLFSPIGYKPLYTSVLDVSGTSPMPSKAVPSDLATLYDVDDQTGQMLLSLYENRESTPTLCVTGSGNSRLAIDSNSFAMRAMFTGRNSVAFLSGSTLNMLSIGQPGQKQTYHEIDDFAISADKNFICLAKGDPGGDSDIYVGELRGGEIENLSLLFKGFESNVNGIYFSPDDKRICVSGSSNAKSTGSDILVLTFQ